MPMIVQMVKVLILKGIATNNDLSLCWTNLCVDTLNSKCNERYAKSYDNVKEVKGHGNTKFILHKNLQLMAYKTSLNKKYYNSEDFIVVDFDDGYFYLKTPKRTQ